MPITRGAEEPFTSLEPLFAPRSIAVVGASNDGDRIAGRALRYLLEAGYSGPIFPVNPKRARVQGLPAYPSVSAIGEPVDLAIVSLPARHCVAAVRECARSSVRAAIVFAAGFAEIGAQGERQQAELQDIATRYGIRILGPNCLGLMNINAGVTATFSASIERIGIEPTSAARGIGFVSQSGAFGSHCFAAATRRGLAFSCWVTTGNECDVELADCLAHLAGDPDTSVIMAYLEGCRDGAKLAAALELARRNRKPVVVLKVGRSEVGASAAASHTGSLVGADTVFDAVFQRYGAHRVNTIDELLGVAEACAHGILPGNERLGLVTVSGGVGILMADRAGDRNLEVPALSDSAQQRLRALWPAAAVRNPVDTTAQVINNPELIGQFVETVLTDRDVGSLIIFLTHVGLSESAVDQVCAPLSQFRARFPDRLIIISLLTTEATRERLTRDGFLVVDDPCLAVDLVHILARLRRGFDADTDGARAAPVDDLPVPAVPNGSLGEHEAKQLLRRAGVPAPPERIVYTAQEAVRVASVLGGPVVLKVATARARHKSDVGGVLVGLDTGAQIADGFARLCAVADEHWPGSAREGVLVAAMAGEGVETIVGFHRDDAFGQVMMFGLGGVYTEVLRDVTFRLPPITAEEAREMIAEVRGHALLEGYRGAAALDLPALAQAIAALSRMAVAWRDDVESVEVNPLWVGPAGAGVLALDALVVGRTQEP